MKRMPATPDAVPVDEQAADTVMMLVLMLERQGEDRAERSSTTTIASKTLGLAGFDPIARAVARRAFKGFGMRVLVHGTSDADRSAARRMGIETAPSLDSLFAEADFISLHGRPKGGVYVDAERLNQMKPDACLVNAAHGGLIDQQALVHALWFETIGGAGIAVPPGTFDRVKDLVVCENAIVLSHPETIVDAPVTPSNANATEAEATPWMHDNVVQLFDDHRSRG